MNIKQIGIYITGTVIFFIIWGINNWFCLALLAGFGIGYVCHNWLNEMFVNIKNAFVTDELNKRKMRQQELELELERLKQGD